LHLALGSRDYRAKSIASPRRRQSADNHDIVSEKIPGVRNIHDAAGLSAGQRLPRSAATRFRHPPVDVSGASEFVLRAPALAANHMGDLFRRRSASRHEGYDPLSHRHRVLKVLTTLSRAVALESEGDLGYGFSARCGVCRQRHGGFLTITPGVRELARRFCATLKPRGPERCVRLGGGLDPTIP
jgi:hypothetical protein